MMGGLLSELRDSTGDKSDSPRLCFILPATLLTALTKTQEAVTLINWYEL